MTLKFDPSDVFDARFKFNYGTLDTAGPSESRQYIYCPFGFPQLPLGVNGSGENCRADDHISFTGSGPDLSVLDPGFGDGDPSLEQDQLLSSLEMNYRPSDTLTLTSLSSLYRTTINWLDPYFTTSDPQFVIVGDYNFTIREASQELRLASQFAGPVDFLVGGYFQDSKFLYDFQDGAFPENPFLFSRGRLDLAGSHVSVFGQLQFRPTEQIELSGGGRYSREEKKATLSRLVNIVPPSDPKHDWTNFSPELTAAWRPSSQLTIFASYKRGFLSGGLTPTGDAYDQQKTKGGEVGLKALLFDNKLRTNISAYHYSTTGLQVTFVEGIAFAIANAGKGTVEGIEADFTWQTGIEGLTLRGAVGYNDASYNDYTTLCYPGQTVAAGCNLGLLPSGAFSVQDLEGRPFHNAPEWSGNVGVNYERDMSGAWRVGLSTDLSYSSSYFTDPALPPTSKVDDFVVLDAGLRLASKDGLWEVALLGRNLTNEHPYQISYAVLFTGGPSGTSGPTFDADRYAHINRGRQVALQITRRFGAQ